MLGVETVQPLSVSGPNPCSQQPQPVPPTGWQGRGCPRSGVLGVTLAVQAGCAIRPTTSEECAYGRHSPSDAFERVRRVEVLGLATDGCWI